MNYANRQERGPTAFAIGECLRLQEINNKQMQLQTLTSEDWQLQFPMTSYQVYDEVQSINNCQGDYVTLTQQYQFDQLKPEQLESFIEDIRSKDLSALLATWNQGMAQRIRFILDNWRLFAPSHTQPLRELIQFVVQRITFHSFNEQVYPRLAQTIARASSQLIKDNPKGRRSLEQRKDQPNEQKKFRLNPNNIYFGHFLNQLVSLALKNGSIIINESQGQTKNKVPLSAYIPKQDLFKQNRTSWKLIMFIATAQKKYNKDVTDLKDIHQQIDKIHEFAKLTLEGQALTEPCDKICCARFFYQGLDICPLENINIITRAKLEDFQAYVNSENNVKDPKSKKEMPNKGEDLFKQNELKQTILDIVGLLNRGGGVILFNIDHQYLETRPRGASILQQTKEVLRKLIALQIKCIHPRVNLNCEVTVSFVPVIRNPYDYGFIGSVLEEQDQRQSRLWIEGIYVMRIAVIPTQRQKLYVYHLSNSEVKSAIFQQGKRVIIEGRAMLRQMKRKYQFFQLEGLDEEERALLQKDYTYMQQNHKCVEPYRGKPVHVRIAPSQDEQKNPQKLFSHMSLMVAPRAYYNEIQQKLKNKGIECCMYKGFQLKYPQIKPAMGTVPLFHNCRFDQLSFEVTHRPEFTYDRRTVLVIYITTHLRLADRIGTTNLPKHELENLQSWINKEFPGERVRYFTFLNDDNQIEHYIKSESKLSTVFLYYILHHFNEKTLFKDPKTSKPRDTMNIRIKQPYAP